MAYCTKDDLRKGDIPLAAQYGDGSQMVDAAADEMDSQLGHIYVTPIVFANPLPPAHRPSSLLLKNINILLASGRLIMDMAAGGEDRSLHSYGRTMWREGVTLLEKILAGEIVLVGAELIPEEVSTAQNTGPSITQEDPYSLVANFYYQYGRPAANQDSFSPVRAYDDRVI